MILKRHKVVKAVALFLAFSIFQLYAQVGAVAQEPATSAPQNVGKLWTSGNKEIRVDKNEAQTGATILSGATLETPDCVTATVRIGPLDEVNLGTNSVAMVEYSDTKVRVVLRQGCARLRVGPNVEGVIETPDGKTTPAMPGQDASNNRSAEVCYPSGAKSDFTPSCVGGGPGGGIALVVGGIAVAITSLIGLIAASSDARAENASFSAPT